MPCDAKVMAWVCFGGSKVGDLYIMKEILNKKGYHTIM